MNVREALDNIYKEFEKTYEEAKEALNAINLDLASENEDLVERIGKLTGYIDFLRNTSQGKKKSLNLLEKVVKGELEEIRAEEPFIYKPCISEGVCKVDAAKMLEHIDEEVRNLFEPDDFDNSGCYNEALTDVLEILNSHARRLTDETNWCDGVVLPDNATNGDVMRAMFKEIVYYSDGQLCSDWWNAPYKGGKE